MGNDIIIREMKSELDKQFKSDELMPSKLMVGISDPDYLESLSWSKNIKVTNFIPTVKYTSNDPIFFRNNYLKRQTGLLSRLERAGKFIAENNLQTLKDIKPQHKEFMRSFVNDAGIFFSKTLFFSLKSKEKQLSLTENLVKCYPHIERQLISTPSRPYSSFVRMLKLAEFSRNENHDFVDMFCGGNFDLANRFKSKLDLEEEIVLREKIMENSIKKGYAMIGRNDLRLLDDLLVIDHTLESWIWRNSVATAPLFHMYNLVQETVNPTGSFVKENGYLFDLKVIREKF